LTHRLIDSFEFPPLQQQPHCQCDHEDVGRVHLGNARLGPEGQRESEEKGGKGRYQTASGDEQHDAVEDGYPCRTQDSRHQVYAMSHIANGEIGEEFAQPGVEGVAGGVSQPQDVGYRGQLVAIGALVGQAGRQGSVVDGQGQGEDEQDHDQINPGPSGGMCVHRTLLHAQVGVSLLSDTNVKERLCNCKKCVNFPFASEGILNMITKPGQSYKPGSANWSCLSPIHL